MQSRGSLVCFFWSRHFFTVSLYLVGDILLSDGMLEWMQGCSLMGQQANASTKCMGFIITPISQEGWRFWVICEHWWPPFSRKLKHVDRWKWLAQLTCCLWLNFTWFCNCDKPFSKHRIKIRKLEICTFSNFFLGCSESPIKDYCQKGMHSIWYSRCQVTEHI